MRLPPTLIRSMSLLESVNKSCESAHLNEPSKQTYSLEGIVPLNLKQWYNKNLK